MRKYTSQGKIEAYLERSLSASEKGILEDLIIQVSRFIQTYTSRDWLSIPEDEEEEGEEEEEATIQLYDGEGGRELYVDDFTELEKVELLDSEGSVYQSLEDGWIPYPLNVSPKESIYLRNQRFPKGRANIQITAIFNSGAVPEDVVLVATSLCGIFYRKNQTGVFKKESIEGYSYEILSKDEFDEEKQSLFAMLDTRKKISL